MRPGERYVPWRPAGFARARHGERACARRPAWARHTASLGDEGLKGGPVQKPPLFAYFTTSTEPTLDDPHVLREMIVCSAGRPARVDRCFPALPSFTLALSSARARSLARSLHIYLAPFSPVITASQRAHLDDGLHLHSDAERKRVGAWFGQGLGLA